MALKKMTNEERKREDTRDILKLLLSFKMRHTLTISPVNCVARSIEDQYSGGAIINNDFYHLTKSAYGYSDDPEDYDYMFVKTLTALSFISCFRIHQSSSDYTDNFVKRMIMKIEEIFPEYKILHKEKRHIFFQFEPTVKKSIESNLDKVEIEVADPIKELMKPLLSDDAKVGLISKIYSSIEKIPKQRYAHLNETDKNILLKQQDSLKMLINKVSQVKGHKTESTLKVSDISYAIATMASIIHKLLNSKTEN